MYNKQYLCTYQYYDKRFREFIMEPFDKSDVEDFELLSDELFRVDLCNAFNTETIDEDVADRIVELTSNKHLVACLELAARIFPLNPELVLFTYDFFFLTHQCICSDFSESSLNLLKSALCGKTDEKMF